MKILSADIETKILNDIDERIREITQIGVERPELIDKQYSSKLFFTRGSICLLYLYTYARVFHM
jgi:hypothetical protein